MAMAISGLKNIAGTLPVSILTGPLRPVLSRFLLHIIPHVSRVSILTGPLRPVLSVAATRVYRPVDTPSFNPHRPVKAGAMFGTSKTCGVIAGVSILTGPLRPVLCRLTLGFFTARIDDCFNPHRPVKAGAMTYNRPIRLPK